MKRLSLLILFLVLAAVAARQAVGQHVHAADPAQAAPPAGEGDTGVVNVPPVDIGADTLLARQRAEEATIEKFKVFHDFQFKDRIAESGITFVQHIVEDAGKTYKAAHYDHGNGIAAADVDGDGLIDIYFVNQVGGNELWKNLGNGTFKNITAEAGVALPGRISVSATFADIDNDGDQDLYVTTVRGGNALFENDGHGHFKDITKQAGLEYVGHSSAAVFFDYDNDGLLDLFLVNVGKYTTDVKGKDGYYLAYPDAFQGHLHPERTEYSILYHNLGGNRFADVSKQMKLVDGSWSGDATITDFNQDGWPDLYVLNMQGNNHYYVNMGGKYFVDKTPEVFPKTPWGAMGVKVFDYNNDGLLDLFITDMHSDMIKEVAPEDERIKFVFKGGENLLGDPAKNIFGNAFFKNKGDGTFEEVSNDLGLENYWPWGVSVEDLNADGWQDVLITSSMNYPFRYGVNSLLLNNLGQQFLDAEFMLGIEPRRGGRTRKPWFTLECSGEDRAHPLCRGRSGHLTVTGTLGTRSSVIFDVDGDGDLDIVTNEFNAEPQVLISNLSEKKAIHWLKLRLIGKKSNRNGLGAVVTVRAGGRTMTQLMDGKSGYLSHSILPLYFGLGEAAAADGIEVKWPSGRKQTLAGPIAGNRQLDVEEPAAEPAAAKRPGAR
ncbi:MAG TPA: CRTAC1 family protein [Thermoanaerobaculia bacterium]|nr:CRTAC1 family protein [Thermoanaerobaculia bacterium]